MVSQGRMATSMIMRRWIGLLEGESDALRARIVAMQASLPTRWRQADGSIAYKHTNDFGKWLATRSDDELPELEQGLGAILNYLQANPKAKMRVASTRRPRANLATLQVMLQRTGRQFVRWLQDLYKDDPVELRQCRDDPKCKVNMLEDYLRDLGIEVRNDGLISFWVLDQETQMLIGELPVALYHFTSSRMVRSIRHDGLEGDRATVNYRTVAGVYLTTERSGNAVTGYIANAVRHHGGHGVMLTVKCYLHELSADPDDADISSGRTQFMMDYVPPDRILAIERASA